MISVLQPPRNQKLKLVRRTKQGSHKRWKIYRCFFETLKFRDPEIKPSVQIHMEVHIEVVYIYICIYMCTWMHVRIYVYIHIDADDVRSPALCKMSSTELPYLFWRRVPGRYKLLARLRAKRITEG